MKNTRLVHSTGSDRIAPERPAPTPPRPAAGPPLPEDGVVRIVRERVGRGGKTVTVIHGLPERDLGARAAELKRLCGAGGTVKDGAIEIQGDQRERVAERLRALGYTVKLAGG